MNKNVTFVMNTITLQQCIPGIMILIDNTVENIEVNSGIFTVTTLNSEGQKSISAMGTLIINDATSKSHTRFHYIVIDRLCNVRLSLPHYSVVIITTYLICMHKHDVSMCMSRKYQSFHVKLYF